MQPYSQGYCEGKYVKYCKEIRYRGIGSHLCLPKIQRLNRCLGRRLPTASRHTKYFPYAAWSVVHFLKCYCTDISAATCSTICYVIYCTKPGQFWDTVILSPPFCMRHRHFLMRQADGEEEFAKGWVCLQRRKGWEWVMTAQDWKPCWRKKTIEAVNSLSAWSHRETSGLYIEVSWLVTSCQFSCGSRDKL